ncbi:NAD-dependent epimerase/dehydratase family protein [Burkholderia ubonensis]|uniref:NAD-dependent epimerase/dehydratase family protein n=1 Tax=Burkholderia ubonensis TaxID=101571 RepID=UPI002AB1D2B0|nr:NAD(P)-dependent oxidoreductase [Burkholderia ubonensis]
MTTLITGAGLIGRLTARQLLEQGAAVVLADIRRLPSDDLPIVQVDVTDWDALADLIRKHRVDSIVHTAAMLTPAIRQAPLAGVRVNVMGTANVLEAARQCALRRVVIASSTTVMYSAFGSMSATPIPEDFPYRIVSERPASIYACTKVANEHLALAYTQQHDVDAVVLRYGAVLGAGSDAASSVPGQMLDCLLRAARSGEPARYENANLLWGGVEEFIDARDCATAAVAALVARHPVQRIYNIATGECFTFDEFVEVVRRSFPALRVADVRLPEGGLSGFACQRPAPSNVEAAWRELKFRARHSLPDTISHIAGAC